MATEKCPKCGSGATYYAGYSGGGKQIVFCRECRRKSVVGDVLKEAVPKAAKNPTLRQDQAGHVLCPKCGSAETRYEGMSGKRRRIYCHSCGKKTSVGPTLEDFTPRKREVYTLYVSDSSLAFSRAAAEHLGFPKTPQFDVGMEEGTFVVFSAKIGTGTIVEAFDDKAHTIVRYRAYRVEPMRKIRELLGIAYHQKFVSLKLKPIPEMKKLTLDNIVKAVSNEEPPMLSIGKTLATKFNRAAVEALALEENDRFSLSEDNGKLYVYTEADAEGEFDVSGGTCQNRNLTEYLVRHFGGTPGLYRYKIALSRRPKIVNNVAYFKLVKMVQE